MTYILRTPVSEIVVGQRHRQDLGDIAGLAKSIAEVGLLQPIIIKPDKQLVAGRRRLEAIKELGWDKVEARVVDNLDDALLALRTEHDENTCRKDFTTSEKTRIGMALEALEKAKAKERQKRKPTESVPVSLPEQKGDTRDKVAEALDMSGRTYEKAKEVVQAAEADPELRPVVEEMDRTGKVDPAHKKVQQKRPANKKSRRKRRPWCYDNLDPATKEVLGDHPIGYVTAHMERLHKLHPLYGHPDYRQPVARLLVEGKAKNVKEALAILETERQGSLFAENQTSQRQLWFRGLAELVKWTMDSVAVFADDGIAWYAEPGAPGAEHNITAEQVTAAIEQLQRIKRIIFFHS